jgi:hypothetical protein
MSHGHALDYFADALLDPGIAARDIPGLHRSKDIDRRLSVYRNNVVVGLLDTMATSFPVTQAIVGDDFFRAMMREYVRTSPPTSPVLIEYASGLPAFVRAFTPADSVPYLSEIATIEAMRIESYHAADVDPVAREAYLALAGSPETLARTRVLFAPSCRFAHCTHAAYSIWAAHRHIDGQWEADLSEVDVDQPEDVMIVRPHFDPETVLLPPGGFAFLQQLSSGGTFEAAIIDATDADDKADPASLLALLIERDLVVEFN